MRSKSRFGKFFASLLLALVVVPGFDPAAEIAVAVPPPAPALLAPANGASVTIPLTISWSQVPDAGGYNWEISLTSDFASVIERNLSLLSGAATTQDIVSGLANGTYFWRVQAVSRDLEAGAWSSPRSFTVTGRGSRRARHGSAQPSTERDPVPLVGEHHLHVERRARRRQLHPAGVDRPDLPGRDEVAPGQHPGTDRDDLVQPRQPGQLQGTRDRRQRQRPDGTAVEPVDFSVLDSNPFPAPPTLVAPANGTSQQLPLTLSWTHVPNHHELGYTLQISRNSSFTQIESSFGVTENSKIVSSLTTGTKFWRVRSQHGYIGSNEAYTAWSATGTFTVLATPLRMGAVTFPTPKFSGGEARGSVEITGAAPAGGATVTLTTSHPNLLPELPSLGVHHGGRTRRSTCSWPRRDSPTRSGACASASSRRRRR